MSRKKKNIMSFFCVGFIAVIIATIIINSVFVKNEGGIQLAIGKHSSALIGLSMASVIDYGDHYQIACHYPQTGHKKVDEDLRLLAQEEIDSFISLVKAHEQSERFTQDEKWLLGLDFTVVRHSEDIVSFVFEYSLTKDKEESTRLFSGSYDLKTETPIVLGRLFANDYDYLGLLAYLTKNSLSQREDYEQIKEEGLINNTLTAINDNYSCFALAKKHLCLYFPVGTLSTKIMQTIEVEIPFSALGDCFLLKNGQLPPFNEADLLYISANRHPKADPDKPMIALTFDDGPSIYTPKLLDYLEEYDARATFFVLGNRAEIYQETLARAVQAGCQIGNHGYNHIGEFTQMDDTTLEAQVNNTNCAIEAVVNQSRIYIRPPYGSINQEVADKLGVPIILWDIDTKDWKNNDTKIIANQVIKCAHDGAIILMHDCYFNTVEAIPLIIKALKEQEYQFVTVEEMLVTRGIEPAGGKIYYSTRVIK
ncbi:MAG: polysaccharide deacetylase family protein [Clostridia bacterium]|nr:polysaccharide deacetylase family protein [Clostridia bacterium]